MNDNYRNDSGLSDALGAVILISVVTLGIAIAGMTIISSPLPEKNPAMSAEVTYTGTSVFVRHTGGDTLANGEYQVLLTDVNGHVTDFSSGGTMPERWSAGETLEYTLPSGMEPPVSVLIVASTSRGRYLIREIMVISP